MKGGWMLLTSRRCMCSLERATRARSTERLKFSWGRHHGAQYWAVTHIRGPDDLFAPPPCQVVPRNNNIDPAGMTAGTEVAISSSVGRWSSQLWLPGITTVAPLSSVKSSTAMIVAAPSGGRGRGHG